MSRTTGGEYVSMLLALIICLGVTNLAEGVDVFNCTGDVMTLSCEDGFLRIDGAWFGHTTACRTPNRLDCVTNATFVWSRCSGRRTCSVHVPQERSRGRCNRTSMYLRVNYTCDPGAMCPVLPSVLNSGRVTQSSPYPTVGTTIQYTCNEGYVMMGSALRTCGSDSQWTGEQPTCAPPVAVCPPSPRPRRTYGLHCFEFVTSVATWEQALDACASRNGSLAAVPGNTEGERDFLTRQLNQLEQLYKYVWLAKETVNVTAPVAVGTTPTCPELFSDDKPNPTWRQRNRSCSLKNAYVCAYKISPRWREELLQPDLQQYTKTGIGIGVAVGLILILTCLFCIFCKDRNHSDDSLGAVEEGKLPPDKQRHGGQNEAAEEDDIYDDTYDDTLPECDVTSSSSGGIPAVMTSTGHKYAKVKRPRQRQADYDEVYASMGSVSLEEKQPQQRPPGEGQGRPASTHSHNNTYENVTIHRLVGSLREKLIRPWRPGALHINGVTATGSSTDGDDGGTVESSGGDKSARTNGVAMRTKPQPAPKPAIRQSALDAKLKAIKADAAKRGRAAAAAADAKGTNSSTAANLQAAPAAGSEPAALTRPARAGAKPEKPPSGIEIVENEIYDGDKRPDKLTEL